MSNQGTLIPTETNITHGEYHQLIQKPEQDID